MAASPSPSRVGAGARALGFAGLLPPLATTALVAAGRERAAAIALTYALVILSFLGGMWWGFAMRRTAGQARLAAAAVVPSLAAAGLALLALTPGARGAQPWLLVAAGTAVLLTLPVDRRLARGGEAPAGWMALRIPLSAGLGGLTILAGILAAR